MTDEKKPVNRQMKFLGGVWESKGRRGVGLKQVFSVEELRWMLEKAETDAKRRITLFTDRRMKPGDKATSPTHTTICWVLEGEWGWDPDMPVHVAEPPKEPYRSSEPRREDPFA